MGKQKQQVISRFFAPKPKSSQPPPPQRLPQTPRQPPPITTPPKVTSSVSFSPAKRKLLSTHLLSSSSSSTSVKKRKISLSPHTHNPTPPLSDPTLHQKFLQKLLEPPTTSSPEPSTSTTAPKYSPLEQQVVHLKNKYPDVLLMVEVGYRYRFFGEDAEIAGKVLGIYAHMDRNFMTASVPTFRLNVHVRRLVYAGYKVGVVKQTETAAIKARGDNKTGPFCRGLSALYTKATLEAAEEVGGGEEGCGGESNYMVCVVEKEHVDVKSVESRGFDCDVRIGVVAVEVSTGDVIYGEFDDDFIRSGLEAVVLRLSPAELILGHPFSKQTEKFLHSFAGPASNVRVENVSRDCFNDGGALAEVMSLYEKMGEDNTKDDERPQTETTKRGDHFLAIEVLILYVFPFM